MASSLDQAEREKALARLWLELAAELVEKSTFVEPSARTALAAQIRALKPKTPAVEKG